MGVSRGCSDRAQVKFMISRNVGLAKNRVEQSGASICVSACG